MDVTAPLRELLEYGFPVDDEVFPWGTELMDVEAAVGRRAAAAGQPPVTRPFGGPHNGFAIPVAAAFGIPTVRLQVWAPAPTRPVVWIYFDLAPGHGSEGVPGLARLRPIFDAALDEQPERMLVASGKPNPYGVAAQWTSGSTLVHLWTRYQPSSFLDGNAHVWSSGSLRIERDERALLAPYLAAKQRPQPWEQSAGEFIAISAPGLRRGGNVERALSTRDDEYVTPAWLAGRLGREQVAIWAHRGAGVWGFGDAALSRVMPLDRPSHFRHLRIRAARGPGYASLGPVVTAPGPSGLDRAAADLAGHGAHVEVTEADDD